MRSDAGILGLFILCSVYRSSVFPMLWHSSECTNILSDLIYSLPKVLIYIKSCLHFDEIFSTFILVFP